MVRLFYTLIFNFCRLSRIICKRICILKIVFLSHRLILSPMEKSAVLLLEDGVVIYGRSFGSDGTASGELCFNTGMTGYQEVFTDPSYSGQVLIMNTVHIGNYGVNEIDRESKAVTVKGVIGRNLEEKYSRFMATDSLGQYFRNHNLVAIDGVDTRALVAHIRSRGVMNCIISTEVDKIDELKKSLQEVPSMEGLDLATVVSTTEPYTFGDENAPLKIAAMDFGIKQNILQSLADRGAFVKVFNADTDFQKMEEFKPDGYFISNGPGDPAALQKPVETIQQILNANKPFFGICLGNQLLGLASGLKTYKLHHGHRGLNHPVRNLKNGTSEITTQNHGFGLDPESLANNPDVVVTHQNLNDNSIEGIRLKSRPAFSVQYHPESTPGTFDARYLFDEFLEMVKEKKFVSKHQEF